MYQVVIGQGDSTKMFISTLMTIMYLMRRSTTLTIDSVTNGHVLVYQVQ